MIQYFFTCLKLGYMYPFIKWIKQVNSPKRLYGDFGLDLQQWIVSIF